TSGRQGGSALAMNSAVPSSSTTTIAWVDETEPERVWATASAGVNTRATNHHSASACDHAAHSAQRQGASAAENRWSGGPRRCWRSWAHARFIMLVNRCGIRQCLVPGLTTPLEIR